METDMPDIIDERLIHITRNALLVAGMEMGKEGDHWPVIKANIHALMSDYEQLKIEMAVREELRQHVGDIIARYEKLMTECDEETRIQYTPHVKELRDVYNAMFSPVDPKNEYRVPQESKEDAGYAPWKSSAMIINQLLMEKTDGDQ